MHVLAPCGSLRAGSFNRGLLRAAAEVAPEGVRVEIAEIGELPLYNEDLETRGWPAPVAALRDRACEADAILFACPEYNYGVSGVSKNAFDRLSRPEGAVGDRAVPGRKRNPFQDKPCGSFGASAGVGGTIRAQLALRQSLRLNAALTMPQPEVFVGGARAKFGPDGALTDGDTREHLSRYMGAFAAWVRRVGPAADRPRPAPPPESGGLTRQP